MSRLRATLAGYNLGDILSATWDDKAVAAGQASLRISGAGEDLIGDIGKKVIISYEGKPLFWGRVAAFADNEADETHTYTIRHLTEDLKNVFFKADYVTGRTINDLITNTTDGIIKKYNDETGGDTISEEDVDSITTTADKLLYEVINAYQVLSDLAKYDVNKYYFRLDENMGLIFKEFADNGRPDHTLRDYGPGRVLKPINRAADSEFFASKVKVWGAKRVHPYEHDSWTEGNAASWGTERLSQPRTCNVGDDSEGTVADDSSVPSTEDEWLGDESIKFSITDCSHDQQGDSCFEIWTLRHGWIAYYPSTKDLGLDASIFNQLRLFMKYSGPSPSIQLRMGTGTDIDDDYYGLTITSDVGTSWGQVIKAIPPTGWGMTGSPDITEIDWIGIHSSSFDPGPPGCGNVDQPARNLDIYFDMLHLFSKYNYYATATVASNPHFYKEFPIHDARLKTQEHCQAIADNIKDYLTTPHTKWEIPLIEPKPYITPGDIVRMNFKRFKSPTGQAKVWGIKYGWDGDLSMSLELSSMEKDFETLLNSLIDHQYTLEFGEVRVE